MTNLVPWTMIALFVSPGFSNSNNSPRLLDWHRCVGGVVGSFEIQSKINRGRNMSRCTCKCQALGGSLPVRRNRVASTTKRYPLVLYPRMPPVNPSHPVCCIVELWLLSIAIRFLGQPCILFQNIRCYIATNMPSQACTTWVRHAIGVCTELQRAG